MPYGSSNNSKTKMDISEVMTSTVFTIFPDQTVEEAAKMMQENEVGCIVLQPRKGERIPLGIVTERDIVTRVVATGNKPSEIPVGEIATRPVITVPLNLDITEAMKMMAKLNIRRIIVVENNNVAGICTYRDLLRVAPSLIEVAMEYEKISFGNEPEFEPDFTDEDSELNPDDLSLGFHCAQCGEWCEESPYGDDDSQPLCGDCYSLNE